MPANSGIAITAPAIAQGRRRITVVTGGTGGVFYPYGGGLAKIFSEKMANTQATSQATGGSIFKNPPGHSSWKLVDEAGWRGKPYGGAMFSPLHSNFLINTGEATAADLEGLGETVRAEVKARTGIQLDWEIKRIGRPAA